MDKKYKITSSTGEVGFVKGVCVTIYIEYTPYEFIIHEHVIYKGLYDLTHKDSGRVVSSLMPYLTSPPFIRSEKIAAAKLAIKNLVEKYGAEYVKATLERAPKIKEEARNG